MNKNKQFFYIISYTCATVFFAFSFKVLIGRIGADIVEK